MLLTLQMLLAFIVIYVVARRFSVTPDVVRRLLYVLSLFNVFLLFALFAAGPRSAVDYGGGMGDPVFLRGLNSVVEIQEPYSYMLAGSTLLMFVFATLLPRSLQKSRED